MIRYLLILVFALFANYSVGAKTFTAEQKKNHFTGIQLLSIDDNSLVADDSDDDNFEALKKRVEVAFTASHPVVFYINSTLIGFTPKLINSPRSLLNRICVLRI